MSAYRTAAISWQDSLHQSESRGRCGHVPLSSCKPTWIDEIGKNTVAILLEIVEGAQLFGFDISGINTELHRTLRVSIAEALATLARRDEPETEEVVSQRRHSIIYPPLAKKGWSPFEWATESKVAPHTVNDYLAGKTRPYASSRLKLAKSLTIYVETLPK